MGEKIIKAQLPKEQQEQLKALNTLMQGCFIAPKMAYDGYNDLVDMMPDEAGKQQMRDMARDALGPLNDAARDAMLNVAPPLDPKQAKVDEILATPGALGHPLLVGRAAEILTHEKYPEVDKDAFARVLGAALPHLSLSDPKAIRARKGIEDAAQTFGLTLPVQAQGQGQGPTP